jgi:DNA-binding LacI/PurR family transcriptional regulator
VLSHSDHLQVDAFIPQLIYSLSLHSRKHGYRVLLETVEDVSRPDTYLQLVQSQRIDGLVAFNTRSDDKQLPELIRRDFPVVLLGFPSDAELGKRMYTVESNGSQAARDATRHLIALGHRRIAHITFSPEEFYATHDRRLGYRRALEESGIAYDPKIVLLGNYSAESGFAAMRALLKRKPRPTALFAGNDTIAMGAMSAIHAAGLRIPEDIAVVGYDDIPTAAYMIPPLTTVRTSAIEHGRLALEMLSKLMRGERPEQAHVRLETPLVVRESCGANLKKTQSSDAKRRA